MILYLFHSSAPVESRMVKHACFHESLLSTQPEKLGANRTFPLPYRCHPRHRELRPVASLSGPEWCPNAAVLGALASSAPLIPPEFRLKTVAVGAVFNCSEVGKGSGDETLKREGAKRLRGEEGGERSRGEYLDSQRHRRTKQIFMHG